MTTTTTVSYPEVSFRTFFGDYLNGLWITWKSKPTSDTGTSDLEIGFQCNLRARLHIFGYGISHADNAAANTATIKQPAWTYTKDTAD